MKNNYTFVMKLVVLILGGFALAGCDFRFNKQKDAPEAIPAQGSSIRNENNGVYDIYTEELATSKDKTIVLFFSSVGCKECRELENDIQTNRASIPPEMIILNVDYDTRADLREKYNIQEERTLVQVDSNGKEIQKIEAITLSEIISSI